MKKILILKRYKKIDSKLKESWSKVEVKKEVKYRRVTVDLEDHELSRFSKCLFDSLKPEYEELLILNYIKNNKMNFWNASISDLVIELKNYLYRERHSCIGKKIETRAIKEIKDYLGQNKTSEIDGFTRFRLKFYKDAVNEALEKKLDDLELEKENRDFIEAFRYFVDIQKPKQEEISIIFDKEEYILIDKDKNLIDGDQIRQLAKDIHEGELNNEEILMSALITAAPKKIHIHIDEGMNKEIIDVIKNIFKDKVKTYEKTGINLNIAEKK